MKITEVKTDVDSFLRQSFPASEIQITTITRLPKCHDIWLCVTSDGCNIVVDFSGKEPEIMAFGRDGEEGSSSLEEILKGLGN